jgi:hypothetical protein
MREAFEDEMAVEGLRVGSAASGAGEGDVVDVESVRDEENGNSDWDIMPELPRFQEIGIGIGSEPSDSDDAETYGSLVRGVVWGSLGAGESDQGRDRDRD